VNTIKHGVDLKLAREHHLQQVRLKGTRIKRGDPEMFEVAAGTLKTSGAPVAGPHPLGGEADLGEVTVRGEIVDAKCYLGVMNPGNLKPHRACAINCIQGGIPPILLVHGEAGTLHLLLAGGDGESLNAEILEFVAEPVAVTGRLKRLGERLILYTSAARISRE
jgi:hypothetical protein